MPREQTAEFPTIDEAYQILKELDPAWLDTTLRAKWRQHFAARGVATLPYVEKAARQTSSQPAWKGDTLRPKDFTTPELAQGLVASAHIHRFRAHDWSATPLGAMSSWSPELRLLVNLCLADVKAVALWWGPERIALYNDSYAVLLQNRDSWALGKSLSEVWYDLSPSTDRFLRAFDSSGTVERPMHGEDDCFFVDRGGRMVELWASWILIPVPSASGTIGFYNRTTDSTQRVLHKRRTSSLRSLEQQTMAVKRLGDFWKSILAGLQSCLEDAPFVALYASSDVVPAEQRDDMILSGLSPSLPPKRPRSSTGHTPQWSLQGALQAEECSLVLPLAMDTDCAVEMFGSSLAHALEQRVGQIYHVDREQLPSLNNLRSRACGENCREMLLMPFYEAVENQLLGFLVLGLNPRATYDTDHQRYIALLMRQLTTSLNMVVSCEQQDRQAALKASAVQRNRKVLEEKLTLSELDAQAKALRFRRMADNAPVGMFEIGADGELHYANDSWYELTGHPRGQTASMEWMSSVHPDDREWVTKQWARLLAGETMQFELRFARPFVSDKYMGGERLQGATWAIASAYAERGADGSVCNVLGCVADISRNKWIENFQVRRAAEALELKKQQEMFMDMTSHEARNPLAAITLSTESILDILLPMVKGSGQHLFTPRETIEAIVESANVIMSCAEHQKAIIDDVLTLSKLKADMLSICPVEIQPSDEVRKVLAFFEGEVLQAKIDLQFVIDPSYADLKIDWVLLDPVRVRQIIMNLVSNAIKFTKDEVVKRITVKLAAHSAAPSDMLDGVKFVPGPERDKSIIPDSNEIYLSVVVQDTGAGIKEQDLQNLFQRFQQGSPKTHIKYGGSGLGLFICRELARLQGGQVGVASQHGQGSVFAFFVKAKRCHEKDGRVPLHNGDVATHRRTATRSDGCEQSSPRKPASDARNQKSHVLVVEDNVINQTIMATQLRRAGFSVSLASHGLEAIDALTSTRFSRTDGEALDCVLMDVEMPVMDGLAATHRIREIEAEIDAKSRLPVIAVTANARAEQQNAALQAGCDAVITKPFRMKELLPQLEHFGLTGIPAE